MTKHLGHFEKITEDQKVQKKTILFLFIIILKSSFQLFSYSDLPSFFYHWLGEASQDFIEQLSQIILIVRIMYNCFAAQKKKQTLRQSIKMQRKTKSYHRRYKTQIRPSLVEQYNRRINGFAKKMEDDPVTIVEDKGPIPDHKIFRQANMKLNISEASFRFKSSEDWKSIFTPSERKEREERVNQSRRTGNQMLLRNVWSQSPYADRITEFRVRDKEKDINPPMKYTNRNSLMSLISLPHLRKRQMKILKKMNPTNNTETYNHSNYSRDSEGRESDIGGVSQTDILSLYNFMASKKTDIGKTQKQIKEDQQLKELAQDKLYFNSLVELQQHLKTKKDKKAMKKILVKCGIVKVPKVLHKQEEQVDNFLEIVRGPAQKEEKNLSLHH